MSNLKPYQPGQSGNPGGKPKGAKDRISKAFLHAFADDFEANGKVAIERMREEDVVSYVKVAAALQPKEHLHEVGETLANALRRLADRPETITLPSESVAVRDGGVAGHA